MNVTEIQTFGPSLVMYRFELTYADFQAGTLTSTNHISTVTLPLNLSIGSLMFANRIKTSVLFGGGSVSAATLSIGSTAGSATTFAAAYDVHQAVSDTAQQAAAAAALCATYAADTITAVLTLTSDVVANMTTGAVYVDVLLFQTNNLVGTGPVGNAPFSTTANGYLGS